MCTVSSPHDPEGRVGNGLDKVDQVQELMEEVAQSETWSEDSKLLKLGNKKETNKIQNVIMTTVHRK